MDERRRHGDEDAFSKASTEAQTRAERQAHAESEERAARPGRTLPEHTPFPVPRREDDEGVGVRLREEDLEPHEGLRYIARLFKVLAVLLILLLIGEVVVGLMQEGRSAAVFLMIEATRLIVFAGFLWGAGDIALLLIESNHDLRATRVVAARLLARVEALLEQRQR